MSWRPRGEGVATRRMLGLGLGLWFGHGRCLGLSLGRGRLLAHHLGEQLRGMALLKQNCSTVRYHGCLAQKIGRETNIVPLRGAILGNLYRRACDMLRSAAWKFSKTHGKMLPCQPCRGSSEDNFQPEPNGTLVGCLVPTLLARCHGEQYVEANVCVPFGNFACKTAWRTLCSSL